jgi:hypothetical protein
MYEIVLLGLGFIAGALLTLYWPFDDSEDEY